MQGMQLRLHVMTLLQRAQQMLKLSVRLTVRFAMLTGSILEHTAERASVS